MVSQGKKKPEYMKLGSYPKIKVVRTRSSYKNEPRCWLRLIQEEQICMLTTFASIMKAGRDVLHYQKLQMEEGHWPCSKTLKLLT